MTATEHGTQNAIRNALVDDGLFFRANVGRGWQGVGRPITTARPITVPLMPGDVLLKRARPFDTGLPTGFADVFGVTPVTITPDMVGQTVGVFVGVEVKSENGRVRPEQKRFIDAVRGAGGRAGIARTPADALAIARGDP